MCAAISSWTARATSDGRVKRLVAALAAAVVSFAAPAGASQRAEPPWRAFELTDLVAAAAAPATTHEPFLDEPAIKAGIIVLAPGAADPPGIDDHDEAYIVMSGAGQFAVGNQSAPVGTGTVIYVHSGETRYFAAVTERLVAIEIASGAAPDPADPATAATTLAQTARPAAPDYNVWNRFFDFATLNLGLYMLPAALGGDRALTHRVDEINVVTGGEGVFQVGDTAIPVKRGSIVWVHEGNPHYFHSLEDDLRILILFHQKPGVPTP